MWIIWSALLGLLVGFIARALTPGRHPRGLIVTIVLPLVLQAVDSRSGWR